MISVVSSLLFVTCPMPVDFDVWISNNLALVSSVHFLIFCPVCFTRLYGLTCFAIFKIPVM